MQTSEKIIDPEISGYLIFCFRKLREVAMIELRQGFSQEYDNVLNFYLEQMDSSIYSRNINLKQYEEIRKLSKQYVEYEIHYSFSDFPEIKNELKEYFDYILISKVPNVLKDYNLCKFDFYERNKTGNFIRIEEITDLLEIYLKNFKDYEFGSLQDLQKTNF
ncbi:MAG: hypothetical protein H7A25_08020 [Leptospiraceae bacterium]|nr:hypothetical protein [Leptospiraceae bacterium]MCP5499832.1 hypothetical protein [Leptospiraceae bacterium]